MLPSKTGDALLFYFYFFIFLFFCSSARCSVTFLPSKTGDDLFFFFFFLLGFLTPFFPWLGDLSPQKKCFTPKSPPLKKVPPGAVTPPAPPTHAPYAWQFIPLLRLN